MTKKEFDELLMKFDAVFGRIQLTREDHIMLVNDLNKLKEFYNTVTRQDGDSAE